MTGLVLQWRPVPRLTLRWRAGDPIVTRTAAAVVVPPTTAVVIGPRGRDGPSSPPITAVAATDIVQGQPLTLDRVTGKLEPADPTYKPRAFVFGLAADDAAEGFEATATRDRVTLPDWTAITGAAHLAPGATYFLSSLGSLSTAPADAPDCVTVVGWASDTTTLIFEPQPPIQR